LAIGQFNQMNIPGKVSDKKIDDEFLKSSKR
jgi:hypothetical protein